MRRPRLFHHLLAALRSTPFRRASAAALLALAVGAGAAKAVPIPIPNFSFEDPNLPADASSIPGATSWVSSGTVYTENPPASAFSGAAGSGTPTGGHLGQSVLLSSDAFSPASIVSRSSIWTVRAGESYVLTVAVGNRSGLPNANAVHVGFLLNDTVVPGSDHFFAGNYSPEGTFTDVSWSYTAQPGDAGKTLKIVLGVGGGGSINFDHVRVKVPEPSAALLCGIGAAGLAAARRLRT